MFRCMRRPNFVGENPTIEPNGAAAAFRNRASGDFDFRFIGPWRRSSPDTHMLRRRWRPRRNAGAGFLGRGQSPACAILRRP